MRVRQQVGRAHEEEEAGVDREQRAEVLGADRQRRAHDRAGERGGGVDEEPLDRSGTVVGLPQHEAHGVEAVREVVRDHGDEDEDARRGVDAEREADPEPVDEAVQREAGGPQGADLGVRLACSASSR